MPTSVTDAAIHDLINSIGTYELSFPYIAYTIGQWLARNNLRVAPGNGMPVEFDYPKPPDMKAPAGDVRTHNPDGSETLTIDPTRTDGSECGPIPPGPSRLGDMGAPSAAEKVVVENEFDPSKQGVDPAGQRVMPEFPYGADRNK